MLFPDYEKTGVVYHIISLTDLEKTLRCGIKFDDKLTYKTKYDGFHQLIDATRPQNIPEWVIRSKAIFASLNYPEQHTFHSHTALLAVKIRPERCWIANENHANQIYEPFILRNIDRFEKCRHYIESEGKKLLERYWSTSISFQENLFKRYDLQQGYDAEVLILHSIPPEDIELRYIISDHRMMDVETWKERFCIKQK